MSSKHLSERQLAGVMKTGNIIIPGSVEFPSFEEAAVLDQIDRMLDYMNKEDLEGISFLMGLFSLLPAFLIKFIIYLSEKNAAFPALIGAPLRMIQIGVKGLIFTLYYSDLDNEGKILKSLNYETTIKMDEDDLQEMRSMNNLENPSAEEVKEIYKRAREAEKSINTLTVKQRVRFVKKLKNIILKRRDSLTEEIQKETKKSKSDALVSEMFGVLDFLCFLEKESEKALADQTVTTPIALMGKKSKIYLDPLGTILIISPWNYPFFQAIVPMMISFVSGNASIYKPSELTPMKGVIESLLKEAGFDQDWIQIVYGDGKVGSHLIEERPDKVFFTGSVITGKKIMEQTSKQLIPVELELGGKDPAIIFEDVNIKRAAAGVVWGGLTNCGQSCTSVERIFVHESIYPQFKEEVLKICQNIKQSTDQDGDSDIGGMTSKEQIKTVKEHLDDALEKGATLLTGREWDGENLLIPPLLLENVTKEMKVVSEETFGPVLPMMTFTDESEAIRLANDSNFGLSASVWSADKKRAERVAKKLQVGNVSINNVMLTEGNPYLPFGGVKDSGIGRFKGIMGFHSFCNVKSILIDSNSCTIEVNWFPYTAKKFNLFDSMLFHHFSNGLKSFVKFALTGLKLESYSNKVGQKGR